MTLYIIRHGETEYNRIKLQMGQSMDIPLNDTGIEQAKELAAKLPEGISKIFSSPLLRTRQTTEIINRSLQLPVIYSDDPKERHFGTLSGKPWEEISLLLGKDAHTIDRALQYDYRPYGGEAYTDVERRVKNFISEVKQKCNAAERILVVTSAGNIRALAKVILGEMWGKIPNGSIQQFEI